MQRRHDRADIGAGVEEADCKRPLAPRKPFGGRGERGREGAARPRASGRRARITRREVKARGATWPAVHRATARRIADPRAEAVDDPPGDDIGKAVDS